MRVMCVPILLDTLLSTLLIAAACCNSCRPTCTIYARTLTLLFTILHPDTGPLGFLGGEHKFRLFSESGDARRETGCKRFCAMQVRAFARWGTGVPACMRSGRWACVQVGGAWVPACVHACVRVRKECAQVSVSVSLCLLVEQPPETHVHPKRLQGKMKQLFSSSCSPT